MTDHPAELANVFTTRTTWNDAKRAVVSAAAVVASLNADYFKAQSDLDAVVTLHLRDAEKSLLSGEEAPDKPERGRKVERLKDRIAAFPGAIAAAQRDVKAKEESVKPLLLVYVDAMLTFTTHGRDQAVAEIRTGLEAIAPALARLAGLDIVQAQEIGTRFQFDARRHEGLCLGGPMVKPLVDKLHARFRPTVLGDADLTVAAHRFAAETISMIEGNS